jgi:LytS/YehU family sensor histidine kinase
MCLTGKKMIQPYYKKYPYFFNLLLVLIFIQIVRFLDWLAWNPDYAGSTSLIVLNYLFEMASFIPVILILVYSYLWAIRRKRFILLWLFIIGYTVFGMVLILFISTWLEMAILQAKVAPLTFKLIIGYSTIGFLIFFIINATFYITFLQIQSSIQKESAHKAETLARDVQLKMLRYQINPHFLFNVLNSIHALIDENSEKARKLVLDMSEYYRFTLNKQDSTITIEKEVESVRKYLEIQKTRFEEDFEYDLLIDDNVKQNLIPSFLIHLLVENAVKYGTITQKGKLIIRLLIKFINNNLLIKVSNTGKLYFTSSSGEKSSYGTSSGIENLKNRLSLYYNGNYSFSLCEEAGWVIASIEILNPVL